MQHTAIQAISCSPRANGNSDHAARYFVQGVEQAGGRAEMIPLRRYSVAHCTSCHHCERDPDGACVLEATDQSGQLFHHLLTAPALFFSVPVYFYHVPSLFKALIDRSQSYYVRHHNGDTRMCTLPHRTAYLCMMAGRPVGEQLFAGSLLTIKYFLHSFNITLAPPLLLRGVDGPNDLAANDAHRRQLVELGTRAALSLTGDA